NLPMLGHAFGLPVGFSDHTIGVSIPLAAVALGACIIEKHFTLDKDMEGWDHDISADPGEMSTLVREGRLVHRGLGSPERKVSEAEGMEHLKCWRRVVPRHAVAPGDGLSLDDLDFKRPCKSIGPDSYPL